MLYSETMRKNRLRIALVAVVLLAGCSPPIVRIGGYPVRDQVADGTTPFVAYAERLLDNAEPDHGKVATSRAYTLDYRLSNGEPYNPTSGGGGMTLVVVLGLADGSERTYLIGCGIGVAPADDCHVATYVDG